MADERVVDGYADVLFHVARVEGVLDEVEDELFRFARIFEGSDELRTTLTDPALPARRRVAVVEDLLGPKATPVTVNLVVLLVGSGRGRLLPAVVDRLVERAAAEKERVVAEVRSAIPLDDGLRQRLEVALGRATGKNVEVKVVVDPSVLGGIVAQVGDVVIDGSIRSRLQQLRETITP